LAQNDARDAGALPEGWVNTEIHNVFEIHYGKGLTKANRDQSGQVPVFGSSGIVGYHTEALVDNPCIVVGRKGAVGKAHLSRASCWPIDTTYYIRLPEGFLLEYIYYALDFLDLGSLDKSTTIPSLNRDDFYAQTIPIPPSSEQRRIVVEIETQFTRLEAGVAALKRAQANLRCYKASVLKAACEGRLVPTEMELHRRGEVASPPEPAGVLLARILAERRARWQSEHPGKRYKEPAPPDTSDLPELSEGWVWISLELAASVRRHAISSGPFGSALGKKDYQEIGVPVIRGKNVKNGTLILEALVFVTNEKAAQLERSIARPGDLVVIAVGSSGQPAIVPSHLPRAVLSQNCNKITLDNKVALPQYAVIAMQIGSTQEQLLKKTTDTARPFLSLTNLRKTLIPLPPLAEQHRIVAEVERRLSVVAELEKQVEAALRRAGRLRQAVLKRAFEGRLVPQDPTDEPASALLERIRAVRGKRRGKVPPPKSRQTRLPTL